MAELPPEEIRIIEFSEEDALELSELFRQVWPLANEYPEHWRKQRMYTPEEIILDMKNGFHFFGSRLQGRIVGVYKAKITEKGFFGEHQTVRPECRTSGLASAMYLQFAEYGIEHGCQRNYCNILVGQDVGERLMKKFGFVPWGDPYEQTEGMMVQMYERPLVHEFSTTPKDL
ncbi:MAG: GNAT family N-acetyltransferase [Candidatus Thorarchaeota archaeon]|nr:MAG: GNAT family N-acetyltransferase [Candidatus Thorarchaeota archaeon]